MKKISLLLLLASLFVGFTACEKSEEAEGEKQQETTGSTENTSTNGEQSGSDATSASTTTEMESLVEFEHMVYNFGEVKSGESVKHVFKFKNISESPIKILDVKPSCGCTAADYTKDKVLPGEPGFVDAVFNSKGKNGVQNKTLTVKIAVEEGAEPQIITLRIKGEVI